jgi:hypothetical protein
MPRSPAHGIAQTLWGQLGGTDEHAGLCYLDSPGDLELIPAVRYGHDGHSSRQGPLGDAEASVADDAEGSRQEAAVWHEPGDTGVRRDQFGATACRYCGYHLQVFSGESFECDLDELVIRLLDCGRAHQHDWTIIQILDPTRLFPRRLPENGTDEAHRGVPVLPRVLERLGGACHGDCRAVELLALVSDAAEAVFGPQCVQAR